MKVLRKCFGMTALCTLCLLFTACPNDSSVDEYQDEWKAPDNHKKDDLTFWYVFDPSWPSIYSDGMYLHQVEFGFGVSAGHYSAGITKFGIALSTSDGTVTTNDGKVGKDKEITVTTTNVKGKRMKFYSANIYDDSEYDWDGFFFVKSKSKTIEIDYVCRYFDSINNEWVETDVETHYYTPKNVSSN